jgi:HD-GYP domain-containing protein (c-di-GMP phosphodiesterase class II)
MFTRENLAELTRNRIRRFYVRTSESELFEEYLHAFMDRILTDPAVPLKVKASTFYVSSSHSLRKAFDDPNPERIEKIKKTLKPMFRHIMENTTLLEGLFSITEHDFNTYTHSVNVGIFATSLAIHFYKGDTSMGTGDLERLCFGYFLHDIGKARVPASILRKEGPLSAQEWAVMKRHPEWGYAILMETGHLTDEAAYIAMQHHERPDGSGYPSGMRDIHPCARICTMADIFDALTSQRPYKPSMRPFDAFELVKKEAFTEFDHLLVKSFITMLGPRGTNDPMHQTEGNAAS